ncbi:MAG: 4-alpha-glucanotransferase [Elusimicrobia bacterium]|nr:4-alpha-glucanotransferase [Elusimicrobiota bacterium]
MSQSNSRNGLRKALSALIINALLFTQQGFALQAFAQTKVEAVTAAPGTGSVGSVGTSLGSASSLSGANLAPAAILTLSQPGLSAVPTVIPQVANPAPILSAGPAPVAAPAASPVPAKAATSARLTKVAESLQPELKTLAGPEAQADQAQGAGERVMAKALGQSTQDLPELAEPASAAGTSYSGAKVHAALRKGAQGPAARQGRDGSWWKDPASQHVAVTVPLYALRRAEGDPGIGKFTDFGAYYRDVLAAQGVDTIHLLPHFAVLDESPYAPVSLYALNESNVDWAVVDEVKGDPALLAKLAVADQADRQAVNYKALWSREEAVAQEAYRNFQRDHMSRGTSRSKDYLAFLKENAYWLNDYAEFMTLSRIIGKPSLQWTKNEETGARHDPRFILLKNTHFYAQWNAFRQFGDAMDTIHQAGGHVLFDIPMFRAKNSVDSWKHPEYFKDLKTRNPGIKNQWINEDWLDLALWDWTRLKGEGYRPMLEPFRHWLNLGFDGARVDALHFAYNFGNGQLASGDEPGDDYVSALGEVLKAGDAFPLAEAFEGKADNAQRYGFVTVYGDWKKLSSHDDPRSEGFMARLLDLSRQGGSGKNGRFVGYTLGDEWNDPVPVKVVKDGNSYWRYRIPLPADPDYKSRARADNRGQMGGWKAMQEGNVWKAAESLWTAFKAAGDTFVKHFNGSVQIWAASLDWFQEEWGRDTFISLPGLLLSTGRSAEAKENMRNFARYEHNGLIPNRIWDASRWSPAKPDGVEYNTVDGSMWFVQAVKKYAETTQDAAFVAEMLPVLRRVMERYASGTGYDRYGRFNRIYMDTDGLIVSPAQATWMDADPEGRDQPVTPRNGKAVEINALWYANLRFLARLERQAGRDAAARALDSRADLAKKSFNEKFWFATEDNKKAWGGSGGALADVVEGDPHGQAIRPNMLFAVSAGEDLLSPERQAAVVQAATRDLLTPYGMRTLSYRDSGYHATYDTSKPPLEKDQAYHQGTVWPWLLGSYVDALARVRRAQGWDEGRIREEVGGIMTPLAEFLVSRPEGSLPEVFDGGRPQEALQRFSLADPLGLRDVIVKILRGQNRGGTRAQAWSVAEAIRVLAEYGLAPIAPRP